MGDCESCSLFAFDPAKLTIQDGKKLLFVFSGDPKESESIERFRLVGRIVFDTENKWRSLLNLAWYPRAYEVDSNARLVWIASRPKEFPGAVEYEQ